MERVGGKGKRKGDRDIIIVIVIEMCQKWERKGESGWRDESDGGVVRHKTASHKNRPNENGGKDPEQCGRIEFAGKMDFWEECSIVENGDISHFIDEKLDLRHKEHVSG